MSTKFNKFPSVKMPSETICYSGWDTICNQITLDLNKIQKSKKIVVVEYYHGIDEKEFKEEFIQLLKPDLHIDAKSALLPEKEIKQMVFPDVTDDRVFGFMTRLNLDNFFNYNKIKDLNEIIEKTEGVILITGIGASILCQQRDLLIYADMARWEIQQRMRRYEVNNLGLNNKKTDINFLYKQAYFVDWRVCDKQKKKTMNEWGYVLDTNTKLRPKMLSGKTYLDGLSLTNKQPFSVVPFFDPGVWGGQW
ncbi:MAG: mannose-6-phosphate isomerase, partial [Flavobacteriaceae bacterium]|nr:mannose-6-phosphate isomerase [Flavobacteriaceae bacterium]